MADSLFERSSVQASQALDFYCQDVKEKMRDVESKQGTAQTWLCSHKSKSELARHGNILTVADQFLGVQASFDQAVELFKNAACTYTETFNNEDVSLTPEKATQLWNTVDGSFDKVTDAYTAFQASTGMTGHVVDFTHIVEIDIKTNRRKQQVDFLKS